MEQLTPFRDCVEDHKLIQAGFFIELECCMCGDEEKYCDVNKSDLISQIDEDGWQELKSDKHQIEGHYCGQCHTI